MVGFQQGRCQPPLAQTAHDLALLSMSAVAKPRLCSEFQDSATLFVHRIGPEALLPARRSDDQWLTVVTDRPKPWTFSNS